MLLVPTLYLQGGQCVSPVKPNATGEQGQTSVVSDDAVDLAGRWMDKGAKRLHIVDLDGAVSGVPEHKALIEQIAQRFPNLSLQVSGGIRSIQTMLDYVKAGVDFLVLETLAVEDPETIDEACAVFPDKVIISLAERKGRVVSGGREQVSAFSALELIERYAEYSVASMLYTDLDSQEQNQLINLKRMVEVVSKSHVPVLLAGGIELQDDIQAIAKQAFQGVEGVVIGSALYDGSIDYIEAQHFCDNAHRFAM